MQNVIALPIQSASLITIAGKLLDRCGIYINSGNCNRSTMIPEGMAVFTRNPKPICTLKPLGRNLNHADLTYHGGKDELCQKSLLG
jgi:hypothetical protein